MKKITQSALHIYFLNGAAIQVEPSASTSQSVFIQLQIKLEQSKSDTDMWRSFPDVSFILADQSLTIVLGAIHTPDLALSFDFEQIKLLMLRSSISKLLKLVICSS